MSEDFLPPVVAKLKGDISDLLTSLGQAQLAIRAFAEGVPNDLKAIESGFSTAGRNAGQALAQEVRKEVKKLDNDEATFEAVGRRIAKALQAGMSGAGMVVGKGLFPFGAMPTLITTLVGAAAPLVPVLAQTVGILGVLPAAAGAAAAGFVTLHMAFHGFGAAITAGASGNLQKYAQALAKLAPSAQDAARAFVGLKPHLDAIRATVQQNFFTGMATDIRALGTNLLPMFRQQLGGLATDLGGAVRQLLQFARTPGFIREITTVLNGARGALRNVGGALTPLIAGFGHLAAVGATFLPSLGGGLRVLAEQFNRWSTKVASDGTLTSWITTAMKALAQLGGLLQDVWSILTSLVGAMAAAGDGTLGVFGSLIRTLAQFFSSATGFQMLTNVFKILGELAGMFGHVLAAALPLVARLLQALVPVADEFFGSLTQIADLIVATLTPALVGQLADALVNAVIPALHLLSALITPLLPLLSAGLVTAVVAVAGVLNLLVGPLDWLTGVFQRDPELVYVLVGAFTAWYLITKSLTTIIPILKAVMFVAQLAAKDWAVVQWILDAALFLMEAPILLIILAIAALVAGFILAYKHSQAFRAAVAAVGHALVAAGKAVVDAVVTGFHAVVDWFVSVHDWFARLGKSAYDWARNTWNSIVGFVGRLITTVEGLPGRVWTAIKALPGVLKDAFVHAVHEAAYALGYGVGMWLKAMLQFPHKVGAILSTFWHWLIDSAHHAVTFVMSWLIRLPLMATAAFLDLRRKAIAEVEALWHGAVDLFISLKDKAVAAFWDLLLGAVNLMVDLRRKAITEADTLYHQVLQFFHDLPSNAAAFIKNLPTMIGKAVADAAQWLYNTGRDVIQGLVNGLKSAAGWVVDTIKGLAGDVASGFKDALGIHSPSTVFAGLGQNIVAGLVHGVNRNAGQATTAVARMLSGLGGGSLLGSLSGSIGLAGAGGGGFVPVHVSLGGKELAVVHAALIPTAQRYKLRTGTTGLT